MAELYIVVIETCVTSVIRNLCQYDIGTDCIDVCQQDIVYLTAYLPYSLCVLPNLVMLFTFQ